MLNFHFFKNIAGSVYTKLFMRFILLIIVPTFIISTILFTNIDRQTKGLALESITQIARQVEANIENQMRYVENIQANLSSKNYLTTFLNAKYHAAIDFSHYTNTVYPFVLGSTGLDYRSSLQIFMVNESIPEGFGMFYKISKVRKNETIDNFMKSDKKQAYLMPKDFKGIHRDFTFADDSLIYLGKIYNGSAVSGIIKIIVPETYLWNNQKDYNIFAKSNSRILDFTRDKTAPQLNYPMSGSGTIDDICYFSVNLNELPLDILLVSDLPPATDHARVINILWVVAISAAMGVMLKILFTWTRKVYRCLDEMNLSIQSGFELRLPCKGKDEISRIAVNINLLLDKIKNLMSVAVEQEKLSTRAQIYALQNQINPHFIYNTMEIFSSQMELYGHYEESEAMSDFAKMLRYNINGTEPFASLKEEIAHTKSYLNIQRVKYPGLTCTVAIPKELYKCRVLRFLMQPFVENSIKHGINRLSPRLHIYISAQLTADDEILFTVYDNGMGMDKAAVLNINSRLAAPAPESMGDGNSIGIDNINRRLKLFFGYKYKIEIFSQKSQWTMVNFSVPINENRPLPEKGSDS